VHHRISGPDPRGTQRERSHSKETTSILPRLREHTSLPLRETGLRDHSTMREGLALHNDVRGELDTIAPADVPDRVDRACRNELDLPGLERLSRFARDLVFRVRLQA
jgi:hypothetical protein